MTKVPTKFVGLDGLEHEMMIDDEKSDLRSPDRVKLFKKDNKCKKCGVKLPPRGSSICCYCSEQERSRKIKNEMQDRRRRWCGGAGD